MTEIIEKKTVKNSKFYDSMSFPKFIICVSYPPSAALTMKPSGQANSAPQLEPSESTLSMALGAEAQWQRNTHSDGQLKTITQ